jgi:hypothetical protein
MESEEPRLPVVRCIVWLDVARGIMLSVDQPIPKSASTTFLIQVPNSLILGRRSIRRVKMIVKDFRHRVFFAQREGNRLRA